jgi:hypothetical protein
MRAKRDAAPTIEQIGGTVELVGRYAVEGDPCWSLFNPSIAYSPARGYAMTFRSSNYVILDHGELHVAQGGKIRNRTWFAELDDDLMPVNLRQISYKRCGYKTTRGVEDPKLLWRDGGWMFTGVMMEDHTPVARHCECLLDDAANEVTRIKVYQGIDAARPEKNWMTCGNRPATFDYVYDNNGVVVNEQVIKHLHDVPSIARLRGGTHLLEADDRTYIAVMHRLHVKRSSVYLANRFGYVDSEHKDYDHYFVRIDRSGRLIEVSRPFKFRGPGIEYAAGIVERGDDYVISFGRNDIASYVATISKAIVHAGLQPVI